jgi:hypothetical protein
VNDESLEWESRKNECKWDYVPFDRINTKVSVNYTDAFLLDTAKSEIEQLISKLNSEYVILKRTIFFLALSASKRALEDITPGELINMYVAPK